MMHKYVTLGETAYFHVVEAAPSIAVREAGTAAGGAPLATPSAVAITDAAFPSNLHEITINVTTGNGFAADKDYVITSGTQIIAVFSTRAQETNLRSTGLDNITVDAYALKVVISRIAAATAAKMDGAGTLEINAYQMGSASQKRITATVDTLGNRETPSYDDTGV